MAFSMAIDTSNLAFDGNRWGPELATILRAAADALDEGETEGSCRDGNGMKVGVWKVRRPV
jgi:hypothetical protein